MTNIFVIHVNRPSFVKATHPTQFKKLTSIIHLECHSLFNKGYYEKQNDLPNLTQKIPQMSSVEKWNQLIFPIGSLTPCCMRRIFKIPTPTPKVWTRVDAALFHIQQYCSINNSYMAPLSKTCIVHLNEESHHFKIIVFLIKPTKTQSVHRSKSLWTWGGQRQMESPPPQALTRCDKYGDNFVS